MGFASLIMVYGTGVIATEVWQMPADFSEWAPPNVSDDRTGGNKSIILKKTQSRNMDSYPIFIPWKSSIKPRDGYFFLTVPSSPRSRVERPLPARSLHGGPTEKEVPDLLSFLLLSSLVFTALF